MVNLNIGPLYVPGEELEILTGGPLYIPPLEAGAPGWHILWASMRELVAHTMVADFVSSRMQNDNEPGRIGCMSRPPRAQ